MVKKAAGIGVDILSGGGCLAMIELIVASVAIFSIFTMAGGQGGGNLYVPTLWRLDYQSIGRRKPSRMPRKPQRKKRSLVSVVSKGKR